MPCTGVVAQAAQYCPAPVLDGPNMITVPVGTTEHVYGCSESDSVECYWNGSYGAVYTQNNSTLPSSKSTQGDIIITVTALGEGSGEVHCISACIGLELQNTSNSITVTVTGKHALCCCARVQARTHAHGACVTELDSAVMYITFYAKIPYSLAISNIKYMKLCLFLYSEVQTCMTSTLGPTPSTSSGTMYMHMFHYW